MKLEDAELREISVNWFPATNEQVRAMARELLRARAVVDAARKYCSLAHITMKLDVEQKTLLGKEWAALLNALAEMHKP